MKIVFATNNKHKLQEVSKLISAKFKVLSLKDIGFSGDIPETGDTLEYNATEKARFIFDRYKLNCFADDTGLEIDTLDGDPGVFSARYAGPGHDFQKNMDKVLSELADASDRSAQFRTVICCIIDGKEFLFEGIIRGDILTEKKGEEGFGYDPIFKPHGYKLTFAEMSLAEKNLISHRALASEKLVEFLDGMVE